MSFDFQHLVQECMSWSVDDFFNMWNAKTNKPNKTRGVSHYGLAIYIKTYLKAKEELWKLKYFTMQKYNLQKKSCKKKPKSFNIL